VRAIDRTSNLLQRLGVRSQIVLMHQGDNTTTGARPNACNIVHGGPAETIAKAASPQVDAFFVGHSHQPYNCSVNDPAGNPRPVVQSASFGRLVSSVDLQIDPRTRDVIRSATVAENHIVTRDVTPDPTVQAIVDRAVTKSAPLANRKVGTITADITRAASPAGEQPLGDVIADAQLAATQPSGAQIAITNPGGIRANLEYASSIAGEGDGAVTYGEAFTVQPFANIMQTVTMTGAQLKAVLEQQWHADGTATFLQISQGLSYTWSTAAPIGSKVSELKLNGTGIDPAGTYRVSINNFLAGGGDGFSVFTQGTDLTGGPIDLDAFTTYLTANEPVAPPAPNRITVIP
jgi:5'-nucleotidase